VTHPRDGLITIYGRKPVLEVLEQDELRVRRVFVSKTADAPIVGAIVKKARARGAEVLSKRADEVSRISKNPKQDQGVAADVEAPAMRSMEAFLDSVDERALVIALDNVTTPANVGMIVRTATVLGWDAIVLPRRGCPEIGPLVIKASAGVAFRAPIVRCDELADALSDAKMRGFCVYGLAGEGSTELASLTPRARSIVVLGNETEGITHSVRPLVDEHVRISMASPGDSLNVAAAAAIACHTLRRAPR
jgi:23S rRNA (guanosine2251-2'-O)-methyltransferase